MGAGDLIAPIYHTNVMMTIGSGWAAICLESIASITERRRVERRLRLSGLEIVALTLAQVKCFAGNMLEVRDSRGEPLIVMSRRARESLHEAQLGCLRRYGRLVVVSLDVIEVCGGGSVRCMMAEIHLPDRR